jgi:hypoxanthine phosphoribosyltransferase
MVRPALDLQNELSSAEPLLGVDERVTGVKQILREEQLREGVERLAREINSLYGQQPVTIVGVLTGSIVLMADLIRLLKMPLRVGVLQASSYRDGTSPGRLIVNSEMMLDIAERDVLLIDDIFDTGNTLVEVIAALREFHPRSVRSAVLLRKAGRQQVDLVPDFMGFDIPDEFVVGYGLDYADHYRNLPYLAALEPPDLAENNP